MTVFLPVLPATTITTCNTISFATILTACSSFLPTDIPAVFFQFCVPPPLLAVKQICCPQSQLLFMRQIYCSTVREDQCDVSAAPWSPSLSRGDCKFSSYFAFLCFRISSVSQRDAKRHRQRIAWIMFPKICKISRNAVLFASFRHLRNKTLAEKAYSA
jgi:hypothetical protein